ncbi:Peptidyl-prolyl cis-trans isomerase FKBP15-1 [Linum perenne]
MNRSSVSKAAAIFFLLAVSSFGNRTISYQPIFRTISHFIVLDSGSIRFPISATDFFFVIDLNIAVSAKKSKDVTELQIGVKYKPESCEIQAHKGDRIKVHYRGMLTDGTVFDSSFERGDPFEFELGGGQVIKGWDQGLLGACVGEKRKLKIPSKLGYGAQGSPPKIPGGATLIFDTELIAVNGKTKSGETDADSEL